MNVFKRSPSLYQEGSYIPLSDFIFLSVFSLLMIIHCIENTSVTYLKADWLKDMYLFRNFLYLVLLAKIAFFIKRDVKEIFFTGIFLLIGFLSFLGSKDFGLFELFIVICAAKGVAPRALVNIFAVIKSSALFLTVLLYAIGILPALYYSDDVFGYFNTYGFCHRNVLGANVALLCLIWFYRRYGRLKFRDLFLWGFLTVITYLMAWSKTSLLITSIIILGFYVFQCLQDKITAIPSFSMLVLLVFAALVVASVACTILYEPNASFWRTLDRFFIKRIRFAHFCFDEYGLTPFGYEIPFTSSMTAQSSNIDKLILDNSYARVLLFYGIIPGTCFLSKYFLSVKHALSDKNFALMLALMVFAVYGLSERYMLDVYYNFPLLIAGITIIHREHHTYKLFGRFPIKRIRFIFH